MKDSFQLWDRKQVARALGYADSKSIQRLVKRGELPEIRLTANTLRYRPEDIEAYLQKKEER